MPLKLMFIAQGIDRKIVIKFNINFKQTMASAFLLPIFKEVRMTKEELKALGLTDEQADKIVKDYADNYKAKTDYNTQATALKQAQEEQKKTAKALEDLKKAHAKDEDLAAQIEKMKTDAAERQKQYDATIQQMKVDAVVDKALLTAKAKNPKAVKALLDLSKPELDGDSIKGLDDQVKALQKSDAYLFEAADQKPKVDGLKPGEGGDDGDDAEISAMQKEFEAALGLTV